MPVRRPYSSYDDGCGVAHALDLVGDRWALIVVRELILGPKRFADLRVDIPGISASVLTQRLREFENHGIVVVEELPAPARATVYDLTPWGRELEEVLQVLGRWAVQSSTMPHDAHVGDATAILAARTMGAQAAERTTGSAVVRLRLTGRDARPTEYALRLSPGRVAVEREHAENADVSIETDPTTWTGILLRGAPLDALVAGGQVRLEGDREALQQVIDAYPLLASEGATTQSGRPQPN